MPRVAYFPDSFHEVNGVAHTSRHFEAFARRRNLPFLCVRAGDRAQAFLEEATCGRWSCRAAFSPLLWKKTCAIDPAFLRHLPLISEVLKRFKPDLIHITGPSELGMLGAWLAHHLGLPLAASWHTNVHEYRRGGRSGFCACCRSGSRHATGQKIEDLTMAVAARFYSVARVLVCAQPGALPAAGANDGAALPPDAAGRGCGAVPSCISASATLQTADQVLGYVGRLSVEKNVALLAQVQEELEAMGHKSFRFLIVGHGGDEGWLRERLPRAEFTGVLRGEALATAYANMDLFVFPSHTDTFGNVVLEALASGVPAIVTPDGGPSTIVRDGETGRIAPDGKFAAAMAGVLADPEKHAQMRRAARAYALTTSWDSVFEGVYAAYETILPQVEQAAG